MHLPAPWFASGTWLSPARGTPAHWRWWRRSIWHAPPLESLESQETISYQLVMIIMVDSGLTWINHYQASFVTFTMEITIQNAPRFLHPGRIFHPQKPSIHHRTERCGRRIRIATRRRGWSASSAPPGFVSSAVADGCCGFGKGGRAKNIEPKRVGWFSFGKIWFNMP